MDIDDFFVATRDAIELHLGSARSPVDHAIVLRHEGKNGNRVKLAAEGGASFDIVDDQDLPIAALGASKAGASLTLGDAQRPTILLDGADAAIHAGQLDGAEGSLTLYGGGPKIEADGGASTLKIRSSTGDTAFTVDANHNADSDPEPDSVRAVLGGPNRFGELHLHNDSDSATITLNGQSGDIEFFNADFAEEFDIDLDALDAAIPGAVMVLGASGEAELCTEEYSSAAVGVVAGGGPYKPALILDKKGGEQRRPIALIGKVGCLADATDAPIRVGDLLTTSSTPGHARVVTDRSRALGAVIGKALSPLDEGTGMIRVLVTLQ